MEKAIRKKIAVMPVKKIMNRVRLAEDENPWSSAKSHDEHGSCPWRLRWESLVASLRDPANHQETITGWEE
jgi:hypothetical protein